MLRLKKLLSTYNDSSDTILVELSKQPHETQGGGYYRKEICV